MEKNKKIFIQKLYIKKKQDKGLFVENCTLKRERERERKQA